MKKASLSKFLQSRVFMGLVKVSPWVISFYFLWLVTSIYYSTHRRDREIVRSNIEEVLGKDLNRKQIDVLFRSTVKGIFRHYFEKLFLACSDNRQWRAYFVKRLRICHRGLLDRFLAHHRGLILVTGHFGAVEFLPGFLTLLGYPVAIVAKFKTQRLREHCKEKAKRVGAMIIDADEKNSFFLALSALKERRILITQCDEVECWKTDPRRSIRLFGTSFQVDRTVAILQKRSGAPVLFGYVRRQGKQRFTVEIEDLCGPDRKPPQRLEETILKKLEKIVYANPDQWYIWSSFQRMKATGRDETAVENQRGRDPQVATYPVIAYQTLHSFPQPDGQYAQHGRA